jgi:hypothetical protein
LRALLGERRWQHYADDGRRSAVADLLTQAAAEGRDMNALVTHIVECRKFEDDETSPSRRVAGVLYYRLRSALAGDKFPPGNNSGGDIPHDPGDLAGRSKAPATGSQPSASRTGRVPPPRAAKRADEKG